MAQAFTLVQLQYFREVVRRANMTEAAHRLNVSQSAVSTAMAQLERALGVDLFIRQRNRALTLSPAGKRLYSEIDEFLENAAALAEKAHGLAFALTGRLSVGISPPISQMRLPMLHHEFQSRYPRIQIDYVEGNLEELHRATSSGECELSLVYTHGLPHSFEKDVVGTIRPRALVSEDHRLVGGGGAPAPIRLEDLADEDYIKLDLPHATGYFENLFRIAGVAPKVRHVFPGYETVRSFVAMGHGYTLLNQTFNPNTYTGRHAIEIALLDPFPDTEIALVWPRGTRLSKRAEAFKELCHTYLSPLLNTGDLKNR